MAESLLEPSSPGFWAKVATEAPGFLSGFVLGVLSGLFANWITHKVVSYFKKKDGPHFSVEVGKDGTYFTGRIDGTNSNQVLEVMKAAAKTSSPAKKATKYVVPETADTTSS